MTCDSCGRGGEDLEAVHRVYLLPEPQRMEGIERWCASCRSQYPHDEAEVGKGPAGS